MGKGAGAAAWAALGLALVAALPACRSREPIRVGFVAGLTGRHYDLGISERNGLELAVAEVNAAGGIGGRPVELLVRDDAQDPEVARRVVEELVAAGVVAIVGHATSAMAEATLPIADRAGVLMLSPTVTSAAFRGRDDALVMMNPPTSEGTRILAEYVMRATAVRRVAPVLDLSNRAYSLAWSDGFREAFERLGGRGERPVSFVAGEVASFGVLVEEALRGRPDAVMVIANSLDSATLCQQVRKAAPAMPILGAEWGFTNDLVAHGGSSVEGALFVQKVDVADASPAFARFRSAYAERYSRPVDFASALAYEAGLVLADALRRDPTRAGVKRALLAAPSYRGLQGEIRLDANGDPTRRHFVTTVRDGRAAVLE
jgi:branched-chain amino acid transport system substrate-binding protein